MFLFDLLLPAGLTTAALVAYLILLRKSPPKKGFYRSPGEYFVLLTLLITYKFIHSLVIIRRYTRQAVTDVANLSFLIRTSILGLIAFDRVVGTSIFVKRLPNNSGIC